MDCHEKEMRLVYALTLNELIDRNPNVYCLEADLSKASGTSPEVSSRHPQNFINCGVQEANMIGVAAGMAREGKVPFCASFTAFATRRVYDQITVSVAYANNNVKIVGTSPGITQGPNGGTHMCFQDLAIMRAMPNMHVYSPADANELRAILFHMAGSKQPTYLQLIRLKMPKIFEGSYRFDPNRAVRLHEGNDVTLVSTGFMTHVALDVAHKLSSEGIKVDLLHYSAVKPFDSQILVDSARRTGAVVTVENQNIIGGLGSAVCEVLCEHRPVKTKRMGMPDRFGEVADPDYLFDKHGFGLSHIMQTCREMIRSKKAY
ncbi:MAG: transketolase family protein [Deltaproteobacteria bacterium]|nr:transketolase family protein [Deltaproteobacteria bacterium]